MNWRCLFGHDWKYVSHKGVYHYAESYNEEPYGRSTRILKKCTRCGKFEVNEVDGDFSHVSSKDFE